MTEPESIEPWIPGLYSGSVHAQEWCILKLLQNFWDTLYIGWFHGVYTTFLEMIFDFDFDPPIYRKTLWKACSKKKIRTCPTNFEHSSRKRGTCMKSVKWALDSDIACWHSLHRSVLDADLNSASNGSSFKRTARENMGFRVKILCFGPILLVCLAKIFSSTYIHHLITFFGSRIWFCIQQNQLDGEHRSKEKISPRHTSRTGWRT
jgi:hypothetical protein